MRIRDMPRSDAQKRADKKYQPKYFKEQVVQVAFRLVRNTDKDIIDRLNEVGNKNGYIKRLIREDIAREKENK